MGGIWSCASTYLQIRLAKAETDMVPRLAGRAVVVVVDGGVVAHAAGGVGAFLREHQLGSARRTGARVWHLQRAGSGGRPTRLGHGA